MKFKFLLISMYLLLAGSHAGAQDIHLDPIPDSLREHAKAVIRLSEMEVRVKSESNLKLHVHNVITLLNQGGEMEGIFILPYDDFMTPSGISIKIYDAYGNKIYSVRDKEIIDISYYDGFSLYTDNRVKFYRPVIHNFPYTVEYSYDLNYHGYITLPRWRPIFRYNVALQKSIFNVEYDTALNIRYRVIGFDGNPETTEIKDRKQMQWELDNVKAFESEPYSTGISNFAPAVMLACNKFEYDGSQGDLSSWNSFGEWVSTLLNGRQELPEATQIKVKSLVSGISDDKEKARVLYEYMQSRVRYVSIQLGIGGFQPFSAEEVDKWNYGDCKALSNYYIALLKEAGIKGIYAITVMDEGKPLFIKDFPANLYFNHAVVCIPFGTDSVWVECTSNYVPFGYMGAAVAGNPALLVCDGGGKIVRVPSGPAKENNEYTDITAELNGDGSARMQVRIEYTGSQLWNGLKEYIQSDEDQVKSMYKNFDLNDFTIDRHQYNYNKEGKPSVVLTSTITCKHFATKTGDRLFVPVKLLDGATSIPDKVENRISPLFSKASYADRDTLIIKYPPGFLVEYLPNEYLSDTEFGSYHLHILASDAQLMIIREYQVEEKEFLPEKYDAFRDFMSGIHKAEKQKLILKKTG